MVKRNIGLFLVLLIALTLYFPSLFYHFVGDDYIALTKIATSASLRQVFEFRWPGPLGGYFRPLQWVPYLLGYALTGLPIPPEPRWQTGSFLFTYHLLNVVFHLANVFLVYLLASFIFKSPTKSALSALIFAVHPINAEVVCWVSVFGDIAFTFFSLLFLILFIKFYLSKRRIPSLLYFLGSLLSFMLALSSKESAICLPFLIILVCLFLQQRVKVLAQNKKMLSGLVYFLIVAFYFILRKFILPIGGLSRQDLSGIFPERIFKIIYYLRDLISPVDLDWLKQFLYHHFLLYPFIFVTLFLVGLFLYIFILKLRQFPVLLFSLVWIAITLIIPVLAPFAPMRRHLYLPLVSYSIFLVSFVPLFKRKHIVIFLLSLFVILEIWTSLGRNHLFKFTGQVVQRGLFELKKELPEVEPDSIIYLVGIPGTAKNTPCFWAMPEEKIKFLYRNKNLAVFCLSTITFTKEGIRESDLNFLDDFSIVQSMQTNLEEFIRVVGEGSKERDGHWITGFVSVSEFKILKRDRFGNVKEVIFRLNPQFLKGRKVYFIGFKDGKMQVLKSRFIEVSEKPLISGQRPLITEITKDYRDFSRR